MGEPARKTPTKVEEAVENQLSALPRAITAIEAEDSAVAEARHEAEPRQFHDEQAKKRKSTQVNPQWMDEAIRVEEARDALIGWIHDLAEKAERGEVDACVTMRFLGRMAYDDVKREIAAALAVAKGDAA
jgi:hypothetical protein